MQLPIVHIHRKDSSSPTHVPSEAEVAPAMVETIEVEAVVPPNKPSPHSHTQDYHNIQSKYTLQHLYDIFHDILRGFVRGTDQKYNSGLPILHSPRECAQYEEIHIESPCVSGIHEHLESLEIIDPVTSEPRKAYRVHVKGRTHDELVWADNLAQDERYKELVRLFEESCHVEPRKSTKNSLEETFHTVRDKCTHLKQRVQTHVLHKRQSTSSLTAKPASLKSSSFVPEEREVITID